MDRLINEQGLKDWLNKWEGYIDADIIARMQYRVCDIPSAEPKAVLYSGDGYADGEMVYDMAECPNCGRKFEYGDETWNCNFCPDCGQALNWERSDKE